MPPHVKQFYLADSMVIVSEPKWVYADGMSLLRM